MWLRVAREVGERHKVGRLVIDNCVALAHAAELAQLWDAVAVVVDVHPQLDVQGALHRRVIALLRHANGRGRRAARQVLGIVLQVA